MGVRRPETVEERILREQLQQKIVKHNAMVLLTFVTVGTVMSYAFYQLVTEIMAF